MRTGILMSALAVMAFTMGCGQAGPTAAPQNSAATIGDHDHDHDHGEQTATAENKSDGHDHSGWWCAEHGVPEAQCSQCDAKVAAEFQKKGDWCAEHDRAKSQCFLCDPSLKEKFAAQYRAKEGKEPPAIEEEKDAEAGKKG